MFYKTIQVELLPRILPERRPGGANRATYTNGSEYFFLFACYAISLIKGDNILGMNLKSVTTGHYLTAAGLLYTDRKLANPYSDKSITTNYPRILLDALKKYKKVANRREVITDSMFEYIYTQVSKNDLNLTNSSLQDWLV